MSSTALEFPAVSKGMSFETFTPSAENMPALQMAILMAENGRCSPESVLMFVYGGTGVGKTHLLSAIANGAQDLTVLFVNVDRLRSQLKAAAQKGDRPDLKEFLIEPDILILDDIHCAREDQRLLDELFKLMEFRLGAKLGVVASSNQPPSALKALGEDRLRLLAGGSIAHIQWGGPRFRFELFRAMIPEEIHVAEGIVGLGGPESDNGHKMIEIAQGLLLRPEIPSLLAKQGYGLHSVKPTVFGDKRFLVTRWRLELRGRTNVVELAYSYSTRKVMTRCWSIV